MATENRTPLNYRYRRPFKGNRPAGVSAERTVERGKPVYTPLTKRNTLAYSRLYHPKQNETACIFLANSIAAVPAYEQPSVCSFRRLLLTPVPLPVVGA